MQRPSDAPPASAVESFFAAVQVRTRIALCRRRLCVDLARHGPCVAVLTVPGCGGVTAQEKELERGRLDWAFDFSRSLPDNSGPWQWERVQNDGAPEWRANAGVEEVGAARWTGPPTNSVLLDTSHGRLQRAREHRAGAGQHRRYCSDTDEGRATKWIGAFPRSAATRPRVDQPNCFVVSVIAGT
jgi:hypothetical protein